MSLLNVWKPVMSGNGCRGATSTTTKTFKQLMSTVKWQAKKISREKLCNKNTLKIEKKNKQLIQYSIFECVVSFCIPFQICHNKLNKKCVGSVSICFILPVCQYSYVLIHKHEAIKMRLSLEMRTKALNYD